MGPVVGAGSADWRRGKAPGYTCASGVRSIEVSSVARTILIALVLAAPVGVATGLLAAAGFVAQDPNLRAVFGLSLLRCSGSFLAGYLLAATLIAWTAMVAASRGHTGQAVHRLLSFAIVPLGFLLAVVAFSAPVRFYTEEFYKPGPRGIVLSIDELVFPGLVLVAALALTWPLSRWTAALPEQARRATWTSRTVTAAGGAMILAAGLQAGYRLANPGESLEARTGNQVALIGIDGGDWAAIQPLIEEGALPNFRRLIAEGSSADLQTIRNPLSPIVWTTVATGHSPRRHGIHDFIAPGTNTPVTSNMRRVPAVWNLLGDQKVSVGVVGWWVTWPAERVFGHMVSSYSTVDQRIWKGTLHGEGVEKQTFPPDLMDELAPLIEPAIEAGRRDLSSALEGINVPEQDEGFAERKYFGDWVFASDRIFTAVTCYLAERYAPRFLATYLGAPDVIGHKFCEQTERRDVYCAPLVEQAYRSVDALLGRLLESLESDATVIVVSDHGFDPTRGHGHAPPGILLIKGPGVRRGGRVSAASVYDILPTVLALFATPTPDDLRGRALLSSFTRDAAVYSGLAFTPGQPALPPAAPLNSEDDEAWKERLRSLGYIQ